MEEEEVEEVEVGISGHWTHCGGPQLRQLGSGRCRVVAASYGPGSQL